MSADPDFKLKSIPVLNSEALAYLRSGDDERAVASFAKLFRKLRENNMYHRELYVVHCNRSAAYLNLGLWEEALWDARRCAVLAEAQFARTQDRSAVPCYIKSFARRGFALMGLRLLRAAKDAFEEGLRLDPSQPELKRGLEESTAALLESLLAGKDAQMLALPAATKRERIANLPAATPLHTIHPRSLLPVALLTPFQADNDHNIKGACDVGNCADGADPSADTYNYVTVQADIRLPKRHFAVLEDSVRTSLFEQAIQAAIKQLRADDRDARVLHLGAGAGLLPLLSLRHGARHVTCAERWLYLALGCKASLDANGVSPDAACVIYKRPTDLVLRTDVPVACNLLVCDMLEDGLLSAGLIPACRHALGNLIISDARVIPAAATVHAQAVEMRSDRVCGFDVSAANVFRHEPMHASATPLRPGAYKPLSTPVRVWHFDMLAPPEDSDSLQVDLHIEATGCFNAVLFWYDLHLGEGITLHTGPGSGSTTLRPALQYLAGEVPVAQGEVLALRCNHNTVQLRFHLEREEYTHVYRGDASFPRVRFAALANEARAAAYQAALRRHMAKAASAGQSVHVLDVGAGSGLLSVLAAAAGAASVTACEIHTPLALLARRVAAANGFSKTINVVNMDAALLERMRDTPRGGCNLVVTDLFDAGLLAHRIVPLLAALRSRVLQPGAVCMPAAATVYCMGVEARTDRVAGFDFSAFNRYRWGASYEAVRMDTTPHRRLTRPRRVAEFFFDGRLRSSAIEGTVKLDVIADGRLNAVCFWFDLHLDEEDTITSAPWGIDKGGQLVEAIGSTELVLRSADAMLPAPGHHWGQALQYMEREVRVTANSRCPLLYRVESERFHFSPKDGVGDWVEKPPWTMAWGGGASVESPHVQRVLYCELLVREFLQRVRCRRFPPIEKDLRMVMAYCGSLFLDPALLAECLHELVTLEAMHLLPEFSVITCVDMLTTRSLELS